MKVTDPNHRSGAAVLRVGMAPLCVLLLATGLLVASVPASAASEPPLTVAYISSLTGPGASEYGNSQLGCQARIDSQNAQGGVDGRKLDLHVVDDQTNPTLTETGVQGAISDKDIGIVANSPLFYLASKYATQAGMPVTGNSSDGPEWGEKPNTNMFDAFRGSENPQTPVNSIFGNFLTSHGGTVIGAYGYGISPLSADEAYGAAQSFLRAGGHVGVLDTSVPFGGVDFTSAALVAQQHGVNAVLPTMDDDSNFALITALEQAGVKLKAVLFPTGYDPSLLKSPVWPSLRGFYFLSIARPFSLPNAGTEQMQRAMEKYAGFSTSDFPGFSQYMSWLGCDLMIKGIQLAGKDPTHAGIIKALRGLKSYNGNGLLPITINYSTVFGHDLPQCGWILRAGKSGFIPTSSKPFCGADYKGTTTLNGS